MKYLHAAFMAVVMLFFSHSADALLSDDKSLIEGAKLCTSYLPRHERQYGIPGKLLAAIASTESGRYNREIGLSLPWPWTINVEGKGYFFDTKEEAIAAVRGFQERGFQSIDVGCMQVNLHHHPNAFANLEQAFDPAYNIGYAAQFLKQNYQDEGSWRKATADYHSRSPMFGEPYARLVFSSWGRIINKVADARSEQMTLKSEMASANTVIPVNIPVASSSNAHHQYYHPQHMHSIAVARDTTNENGVLVIRPEHSENVKEAAQPNDTFVTQAIKHAQRDASIDKGAEVIKVQNGGVTTVAKGQFEGSSQHNGVTAIDVSGNQKSEKQNSVFVFDN